MPKYLYYERGDNTPQGRSNSITLVEGEPGHWRLYGGMMELTEKTRRDLAAKICATGILYEKPLNKHVSNGVRVEGQLMEDFISRLSPYVWRRVYRGLDY